MHKELKILDQQLSKNGLVRIVDPHMRTENSLFRAISMSIFYNHSEWQRVASCMKLCLLCSSQVLPQRNPFPIVPTRSRYLIKFRGFQNKELLRDYMENPDMTCFQKENLELASIVFDHRVELYSLDQSQYLQQSTIALGRNNSPKRHRKFNAIMLVKASNRFYSVLPQAQQKIIAFAREYIATQILGNLVENAVNQSLNGMQGKVHFPSYDQNHQHSRQHKKSLSDCGERDLLEPNINLGNMNLVNLGLAKRHTELEASDKFEEGLGLPMLNHSHSESQQVYYHYTGHALHGALEQDWFLQNQNHGMDFYEHNCGGANSDKMGAHRPPMIATNPQQCSLSSSPQPGYDYQSQSPTKLDSQFQEATGNNSFSMANNCRYAGRLKFFDQNKNYGFIVVNTINEDLFVHLDDLSRAGISKETLKSNVEMRFEFTCLEYEGKYKNKKSKKAVDLLLISDDSL